MVLFKKFGNFYFQLFLFNTKNYKKHFLKVKKKLIKLQLKYMVNFNKLNLSCEKYNLNFKEVREMEKLY